jgi:acyl-coenzyme A thioesterase PaaI-like protein
MTKRKVVAAQNLSRMCLVCGVENPWGLNGRFYVLEPAGDGATAADLAPAGADPAGADPAGADPAGADPADLGAPELLGIFTLREEHQSYPGRLHGGIATAILDETIGRAITIANPGVWGVTAELTVRFRRPLPVSGDLRCVGRITRDTRRLFEGSGEILLDDGTVAVEANGRYVKMTLGEITDDDFDQRDWFEDEREAPDSIDL